jgi:hypothetical protein
MQADSQAKNKLAEIAQQNLISAEAAFNQKVADLELANRNAQNNYK